MIPTMGHLGPSVPLADRPAGVVTPAFERGLHW
jgi:hypothetical protein